MPEDPLREKRAGPAAEKGQQVQRIFGCSPAAADRSLFIGVIYNES